MGCCRVWGARSVLSLSSKRALGGKIGVCFTGTKLWSAERVFKSWCDLLISRQFPGPPLSLSHGFLAHVIPPSCFLWYVFLQLLRADLMLQEPKTFHGNNWWSCLFCSRDGIWDQSKADTLGIKVGFVEGKEVIPCVYKALPSPFLNSNQP